MNGLQGLVRQNDWVTSVQAAEAVQPHLSDLQVRVLGAFLLHGPMTDEELERLPEFEGFGNSTVRKRRTDLCAKRFLIPCGTKTNSRGRSMMLWRLNV